MEEEEEDSRRLYLAMSFLKTFVPSWGFLMRKRKRKWNDSWLPSTGTL